MSELWSDAYHEAGHCVAAWALGGRIDSARMHSGHCDMAYQLPPGTPQAKSATIHALVSLAGQAGEVLFSEGPVPGVEHYSDFGQFGAYLKGTCLSTASPDMAARVLRPVVSQLLTANDRAVHAVAQKLVQHRHCWGDDLMCLLSLQKKLFGVDRGPFGGEDWQGALLAAVQAEVAALEAEATYRPRQAPPKAMPRPALEYKVGSGSATLWIK